MTVLTAVHTSQYAVPLEAVGREQLEQVGGKAANLGETLRAGLPVPTGFCVTTDSYAVVAARAGLEKTLDALAGTAPEDGARLDQLAAAAREALLSAPVPDDVADAVREAYDALGGGRDLPVAVRSSATAEDLPGASFAGQQDTYLNIVGADNVIDATRRCWASLWTDRAVAYRARNAIDPHGVRLAVVVQRQIESRVAGVMFTANPVTGRRREAVIDASYGLGEAVVSGAATPDHFVVDVATGEVRERRIGDKRVRILALAGGGTKREELPATSGREGAGEACLTDVQVRELARLGERVERYYGAPQDTEWGIDGDGVLWLLQARPITTLYPLPAGAPEPSRELRVYFSFNVAQGVFQPLTPMGVQAFRLIASSAARLWGATVDDPVAGPSTLLEAGHRIFIDATSPLRSTLGRRLAPRVLENMEVRSGAVLHEVLNDPRLAPRPASRFLPLRFARLLWRTRIPTGVVRSMIDPRAGRAAAQLAGMRSLALGRTPVAASAAERVDALERMLTEGPPLIFSAVVPNMVAGLGSFAIARGLLRGVASDHDLEPLRRGLRHNPTTEMDTGLSRLAERLRLDAASAAALRERSMDDLGEAYEARSLPPALQRGVAEFLERYGHRGVAEIDLGEPRWRDDARHVLGVLANYLAQSTDAVAPHAQFERVADEADRAVRALAARVGHPLRALAVRILLTRYRELAGLRELPKFHVVALLDQGRRLLDPVGDELAAAGRLEVPSDVYLLTIPEVRRALGGWDARPLADQRREALALERRRKHIPRWLLSDGTELGAGAPAAPAALGDGVLTGAAASAGTVTATARVILDPRGARLTPGEILVAPSTDPGWTPLFLTAGGLVMEMGGPMSHGAIVAREYGIPAVVGVAGATDRIRTGQKVTVDGTKGTVAVVQE
ncbi:MAG TPA: PEP/pyruvate-binding domain-containing protein [Chloroflexota bacterium]|nr:PEP/pyruvate-binding domain-containing protein [Chloroflexota bacterium]